MESTRFVCVRCECMCRGKAPKRKPAETEPECGHIRSVGSNVSWEQLMCRTGCAPFFSAAMNGPGDHGTGGTRSVARGRWHAVGGTRSVARGQRRRGYGVDVVWGWRGDRLRKLVSSVVGRKKEGKKKLVFPYSPGTVPHLTHGRTCTTQGTVEIPARPPPAAFESLRGLGN